MVVQHQIISRLPSLKAPLGKLWHHTKEIKSKCCEALLWPLLSLSFFFFYRCFTSPQPGSATRFTPQQNSPIPSPYTPQSPADYMQYNPPSYNQLQQTPQGEYKDKFKEIFFFWEYSYTSFWPSHTSSKNASLCSLVLVTATVRTSHENKVSGQLLRNSSNHTTRQGSNDEYMNMSHRLGNEVKKTTNY